MFVQLQNIYHTLPKDQPWQDNVQVKDEAAFFDYMRSPAASALALPRHVDLSHPMSSYYISSSHNTYLSGHQLYGEASTEAYTNVLKRGCRCLEIDVWDGEDADTSASGSDEDEPAATGRGRSNSKPSRWSKMKAKATNIRGSSPKESHSHPHLHPHLHHQDPVPGPIPDDPSRLSPSISPQQLKSEPRVLHGYTLTQSVSFRAVCYAIKDSAFVASDLPLIVSLEVHANLDQQQTMVEIMKEIWAGLLVNVTPASEQSIEALPAPGSLKNKILIKVKWTANPHTGESNDPLEHVTSNATERSAGESNVHTSPSKQKKATKILRSLSELGVYTRAYTFKHWDQPEASIPTHVFSLSEGKVHTMHSDPNFGPALFNHNKNFLMRVFPRGTRIRSTNVDPTFHWRQGAQMVALNWQRMDKGMMLNEGMFTGSQGWVLKPRGYRTGEQHQGRYNYSAIPKTGLLELKIQLLSAQNLPLPLEKDASHGTRMKPYVKLQLHVDTHGPPGQGKPSGNNSSKSESDAYGEDEKEEKRYKRRSRTARTDSPDFEGETVSWTGVTDVVDELSFIRYVALPFSSALEAGICSDRLLVSTLRCGSKPVDYPISYLLTCQFFLRRAIVAPSKMAQNVAALFEGLPCGSCGSK